MSHLPRVFLIRATFLLCIRYEINHRHHGVGSILYRVINQRHLLIQQSHLAF